MNPQEAYDELIGITREAATLGSAASVLHWDEQTYMPEAAGAFRSSQLAVLARLTHERFTAPRVGELLAACEGSDLVADATSDAAVVVRETRRDYDLKTKLPTSLVEEMARTDSLAQAAWAKARKRNAFTEFSPWLEKQYELKRQEADCYGHDGTRYNALLDQYEPGAKVSDIEAVFESLRGPLVDLVGKITGSAKKAPGVFHGHFPAEQQKAFSEVAAKKIGYDFAAGRLDGTVHPFCTGLGPGDTRITTRYQEDFFGDCFFSVLHEAGHAMYEQGLPKATHFGTPLAEADGLGMHESQSRMWENLMGRSAAFWQHFTPDAKKTFAAFKDVSAEQIVFAANDIQPTFIRTESDEATYNLHILIRFELEQALLNKDLSVADLPGAWNEKMQTYLGITPPDDARGCLQDVHWSAGLVGYFPTYTLGNLYAAQLFEAARRQLGDLDAMFAAGEFSPLLTWLRENIHHHGRRYAPKALIKRVTGTEPSAEPLLKHLRAIGERYYGVKSD
ncbi:MAG: carboxypeptidase M32 [Phycisphaerae bacterium]